MNDFMDERRIFSVFPDVIGERESGSINSFISFIISDLHKNGVWREQTVIYPRHKTDKFTRLDFSDIRNEYVRQKRYDIDVESFRRYIGQLGFNFYECDPFLKMDADPTPTIYDPGIVRVVSITGSCHVLIKATQHRDSNIQGERK